MIFYGGTFDPPHLGHRDCVELAHSTFPDSSMVILPTCESPTPKGFGCKRPQADFDHRVAMCRLNFESLGIKNLSFDLIERHLSKPNYTAQTLDALSKSYPKKKLSFMLGQDQVENFHLWHNPTLILQTCSLLICRRFSLDKNAHVEVDLPSCVEGMLERLHLKLTWNSAGSAFIPQTGSSVFLLDRETSPAASRVIRTKLQQGLPIPEEWLHPLVAAYIRKNKLYKAAAS
ncbi:MAG: nicotinate-nicotinamide nucleotide adenylyltransferase [Oligoflexales bacterium]|nr:nicotinate-nicotinamide nucleotide adenylyltransferase [Oligoflexales bacterium]